MTLVAEMMYIDGEWVRGSREETIDVVNPATEQVFATVPRGSREDAKRALDSAAEAQRGWERLAPLERASYLKTIARLIRENSEDLAKVLTSEQGKPLFEARLEVEGSAEHFEYYAEFARRIEGDILPSDNPRQTVMILRLPIGVVAAITPWNFPSAMVARKLAPALITGNAVVVKPSSNTPLSAVEIVKIAQRAGVPKGVVNLVTGDGSEAGDELCGNKKTGLVTMTGSTDAGRKIMQRASAQIGKLILELGGKAPLIVWRDADLEWALKCALWARYWNCGQTCISAERMYLDREVKEKFMSKFVEMSRMLRIGDPVSPGTDLGPMVSARERETSEKFIDLARDVGSTLVLGGARPPSMPKGWYLEPTIIDDVDQSSPLVQKEIFGPVVPVLEVESFDRAVEMANDSDYGLASYVFTKDNRNVMKAMHEIKFGETYFNQVGPEQLQGAHTGFRMSGLGAEGSRHGLDLYTQLKTCYIDWSDNPSLPYLFPYS
ncbi:MAG: aldehyde dehydrogenase [Nitrososphaerota archaeon]|nr:aldehyde dehydrogenase [Nitrososphaerota archaeon]MDG7025949.1 aldehyde dehydrogenase [Nitrososphaerota archaeon]